MDNSSKKYSPFDFYISIDFDEIVDLYHGFTYIREFLGENIDPFGKSKCLSRSSVESGRCQKSKAADVCMKADDVRPKAADD